MRKSKGLRAATVIVGAVILAATSVAVTSSASAAPAGSTPAAVAGIPVVIGTAPALPFGAKTVGVRPVLSSIDATLTLNPSDPAGLTAYAMAAATPGNPLYRHFLTTAEFAARFGPSAAAIESMQMELTGQDAADAAALVSAVATDSARSEVAASKLRKLLGTLSKPVQEIATKLISDVAIASVRSHLGL